MIDYGARIQLILNRCVRASDLKNGLTRGFSLAAERTLQTAYESAWRIPTGYSYFHVRRATAALAAACGCPVELENRGGVVIVRVIIEELPPRIDLAAEHLRRDRLMVGYDRLRQPFYHPLLTHLLMAGASGGGKTDCLRFVIYQLVLQGYDVRIVDMKGFSFMPFDSVPGITVARNLVEASDLLAGSFAELEHRERAVVVHRNRDIIQTFRPIAVIIDEAAQIAPKQNTNGRGKELAKRCDEYCAKISQKGREPRVQLIYCTQRPDADIINGQVKANVEAAIAFRCKTRVNSEIILDRGGAEEISPETPGRCIYSGVRDVLLQVPYIGDDDAWSALLAPLKTEVDDEGRSERRITAHAEHPAADRDEARSRLVPGERFAIKARISSAQGAGGGEADRGATARRHDEGVETHFTRPCADGDTAEIDPFQFT